MRMWTLVVLTVLGGALLGCGGARGRGAAPGATGARPTPAPAAAASPEAPEVDLDPANAVAVCAVLDDRVRHGRWQRAQELTAWLPENLGAELPAPARSRCYRSMQPVFSHTGDLNLAAQQLIIALEIWPENEDALRALLTMAQRQPEAYPFAGVLSALDQLYRERNLPDLLALVTQARQR